MKNGIKWFSFCILWAFGLFLIYTAGYYEGSQQQFYSTINSPFDRVFYVYTPEPCPTEPETEIYDPFIYTRTEPIKQKRCDEMTVILPIISLGAYTPLVSFVLIIIGLILMTVFDKKLRKNKMTGFIYKK